MAAKLLFSDAHGLHDTDDLLVEGAILGRGPDSIVPTRDDTVAERHCRISQVNGQWVIEDLNSPTGTFVNGQRIRQADLRHRDVISCGSLDVQFSDSLPPQPPQPSPKQSPDLEATLQETKPALEKALGEGRSLKADLERAEKQLDQSDRLRVSLEGDNRKLRDLASAREQEISHFKRLAELRDAENQKLARENHEQRQSYDQLERQWQKASSQIESLQTDLDRAGRELKNGVDALQKAHQENAILLGTLQKREDDCNQLLLANKQLNENADQQQKGFESFRASSDDVLAERNAGLIRLEGEARTLAKDLAESHKEAEKEKRERDIAVASSERTRQEMTDLRQQLSLARTATSPAPLSPQTRLTDGETGQLGA